MERRAPRRPGLYPKSPELPYPTLRKSLEMMRTALASAAAIVFLLSPSIAQETPSAAPNATFRSSSSLVLVPVVALRNGLPDKTLIREDFQISDNGHPVPITTFDSSAQFSTRPLALWFIVQCNMPDWQKQGSGLFQGQIARFKPALSDLDKQDSVAVAHWCDDGQSNLDLLPTKNIEQLTSTLEQVLSQPLAPNDHGRPGELALQKTLQLIIDQTRSLVPEPIPVLIFLYGDYSAMPKSEADHFIDALLETSAVAYGLKDRRSPRLWIPGEQAEVANYIAAETGGQYSRVTPDTYAQGLKQILDQLHGRYELGFKPESLDGKRHKLTVELTQAAKKQHKGVRLRYRVAYVPIQRSHSD